MLNRRYLLAAPIAAMLLVPSLPSHAAEDLQIGAARGSIDFAVGNSAFFRTSGVFRKWQGTVRIDESNIPASAVRVSIDTTSIDTRDVQQDGQLRGADFFDVAKFPTMTFVSTKVERTGQQKLKVTGDVTLRGITHPMVLDVEVLVVVVMLDEVDEDVLVVLLVVEEVLDVVVVVPTTSSPSRMPSRSRSMPMRTPEPGGVQV